MNRTVTLAQSTCWMLAMSVVFVAAIAEGNVVTMPVSVLIFGTALYCFVLAFNAPKLDREIKTNDYTIMISREGVEGERGIVTMMTLEQAEASQRERIESYQRYGYSLTGTQHDFTAHAPDGARRYRIVRIIDVA